jgi:exopolysaccharide production protein ExoZ
LTYSKNINALQMLRAIAAMLIVVVHSHLVTKYALADYWPEGDRAFRVAHYPAFLNHLYLGVDIFFCISGFIMSLLIHKLPSNIDSSFTFLANRVIRIFPPYWLFSILVVLAFVLSKGRWNFGGLSGDLSADSIRILCSLFLIPQNLFPVLGVGWTLVYEFQFYLLCSLCVILRLNHRLLELLVPISILAVVLSLSHVSVWHGYALSTFNIEFFFGALVYRLGKDITERFPIFQILLAVAGYILLSYTLDKNGLGEASTIARPIGGGLIGMLLISGLIGVDSRYSVSTSIAGRVLMRIGDASYTLYLLHWFVLSMMGKVIGFVPGAPVAVVATWHILSIATAIVIAVIFAERIELPFHKKLLVQFKRIKFYLDVRRARA